eukprot:217134-Pleurochrysis_carterae.AAC.1
MQRQRQVMGTYPHSGGVRRGRGKRRAQGAGRAKEEKSRTWLDGFCRGGGAGVGGRCEARWVIAPDSV